MTSSDLDRQESRESRLPQAGTQELNLLPVTKHLEQESYFSPPSASVFRTPQVVNIAGPRGTIQLVSLVTGRGEEEEI
eukprot:756779-Hanusia_phi.AAC.3